MINMIAHFKTHIEQRENALRIFCERGRQLEGWFKGELLEFLDGHVDKLDCEAKINPNEPRGRRIDFLIPPAWIELKHWHIGWQKGVLYNANWYFSDLQLRNDVDKLSTIESGDKYSLIAMTGAPTQEDWRSGLEKFNRNGRRVECLTDISTYPAYFFLGLLRLI